MAKKSKESRPRKALEWAGSRGEWVLVAEGDDKVRPVVGIPELNQRIADIGDRGQTCDERNANARLIAAAPELAGACMAMFCAKTGFDGIEAAEMARIALKKAGMLLLFLCLSLPTFAAENAFSFAQVVDLSPVAPMGCSLPIAADGHTTAWGWAVAYKNDGKDTLLVSARHVLESDELKLRPTRICVAGKWYDLQLEKESKRLDLVILRLKNQHLKCYPIVPMSELVDGAEYQKSQMYLPGALSGTFGSPSGRGIINKSGEIRALVIRQASLDGKPIIGQVTCVPCEVLAEFVGVK